MTPTLTEVRQALSKLAKQKGRPDYELCTVKAVKRALENGTEHHLIAELPFFEMRPREEDKSIKPCGAIENKETASEGFQEATFSGNSQQSAKCVRQSGVARREAQKKGEIFYHGLACSICKETLRYVGNMNCVACNRKRAAQRGRSKVQRVVGDMA